MGAISFGSLKKAQIDIQREQRREQDSDSDSESDSDGPPEQSSSNSKHQRRSKHAPAEMSAKRPVSVIREIPGLKKAKDSTLFKDIRFDPAFGKSDLNAARKNYAFLDEYRQTELSEMKEQLKRTKNDRERERLKLAIQSLESRLKTLKQRDFEHDVLAKHKKEHKNWHLKRSDKRKLLLEEKFKSMKKKEVHKALERKRKRNAAKERKLMPEARRA